MILVKAQGINSFLEKHPVIVNNTEVLKKTVRKRTSFAITA